MFVSILLLALFAASDACEHQGVTRRHGEIWTSAGRNIGSGSGFSHNGFIMKCTHDDGGWAVDIIACQTPGQVKILIGETRVEGRTKYHCYRDALVKGTTILESNGVTQAFSCVYEGQPYINGATWTAQGNFLMKCTYARSSGWRTVVVGCVTPSRTSILIGEIFVEGNRKFSCNRDASGTVRYRWEQTEIRTGEVSMNQESGEEVVEEEEEDGGEGGAAAERSSSCEYNGERIRDGEEWIVQGFYMKCTVNSRTGAWEVAVSGCLSPARAKILVGRSLVEGDMEYQCNKEASGTVRLKTERSRSTGSGSAGSGSGGAHTHNHGEHAHSHGQSAHINCVDASGSSHAFGSSWRQEIDLKCSAGGKIKMANCQTRGGMQRTPVEGEVTVNGFKYHCCNCDD